MATLNLPQKLRLTLVPPHDMASLFHGLNLTFGVELSQPGHGRPSVAGVENESDGAFSDAELTRAAREYLEHGRPVHVRLTSADDVTCSFQVREAEAVAASPQPREHSRMMAA
jgi:hypothetical protein